MTPDLPARTSHAPISRRNILRLGGAFAATGLAGPLLGSCSMAPADAPEPDDKTFTMYWSSNHVYDPYVRIVEQFEKDHGVTVNWQKFRWDDLQTKLLADFTSGNVPDLVEQSSGASLIPLAKSGDALSLDPYIAEDGAAMGFPDDWQQSSVESWSHDGSVYGIQLHLTCHQLYYNKALLAGAGISQPPATWPDFLAAATELTGDGVHGVAINQNHTYAWQWLMQNGAQYYDPNSGQVLVPRDAVQEAMQFQQDLVYKHKVSPVPTASSDQFGPRKLFTAGRVAMMFTGPWDIQPVREGNPDLDMGIALPLTNEVCSTPLFGSGVFIPKQSTKADLAWDLIKRFTALDVEIELTKQAGQTMPRKSWATSPEITSLPLVRAVAEGLQYAGNWNAGIADTGHGPEVDTAFKTYYQSIMLQQAAPTEAIGPFATAAQEILS
jgi:multiple sugar transport system substrate-binding protein